MTNLERIQKMKKKELILFLKNCDFTKNFPIIEGKRFYTEEELYSWFDEEVKNVSLHNSVS